MKTLLLIQIIVAGLLDLAGHMLDDMTLLTVGVGLGGTSSTALLFLLIRERRRPRRTQLSKR